jgi:hypothetical protein
MDLMEDGFDGEWIWWRMDLVEDGFDGEWI